MNVRFWEDCYGDSTGVHLIPLSTFADYAASRDFSMLECPLE